jgi:hypothetical protein
MPRRGFSAKLSERLHGVGTDGSALQLMRQLFAMTSRLRIQGGKLNELDSDAIGFLLQRFLCMQDRMLTSIHQLSLTVSQFSPQEFAPHPRTCPRHDSGISARQRRSSGSETDNLPARQALQVLRLSPVDRIEWAVGVGVPARLQTNRHAPLQDRDLDQNPRQKRFQIELFDSHRSDSIRAKSLSTIFEQ